MISIWLVATSSIFAAAAIAVSTVRRRLTVERPQEQLLSQAIRSMEFLLLRNGLLPRGPRMTRNFGKSEIEKRTGFL